MLFGIWSMASGVWTTTATVDGAVYRTECHVSANLSVSQTSWMATTKRREENRIQLYAAINLKRNLRSTYALDILYYWSYWQTRTIAQPLCDSRATCSDSGKAETACCQVLMPESLSTDYELKFAVFCK